MSPTRHEALLSVADHLLARRAGGSVLRVAIDGRTASGKTTLAGELAAAIAARAPVIRASIDGFHRPRVHRWARGRVSPEGYYEDARDYAAARRLLLEPLGPGGDRRYRAAAFDLELDEPAEAEPLTAPAGAVLLVDGSFLQRPEFAGAWEAVILVQVGEDLAIDRGAARDAAALGGRGEAEALHRGRYGGAWRLYEAACRPAERADIVWDDGDPLHPRVTFR